VRTNEKLLSPDLRVVMRRTVSSDIADQLQTLIFDGHYKPGDRLPSHQELAKRLGVGLSSVREAVSALVAAGLLEARPGQGTFVTGLARATFLPSGAPTELSDDEIADLIELRHVLEELIIRHALERASEQDFAALERVLQLMEGAKSDPDAFAEADLEFHLALARIAKNKALFRALAALAPLLRTEMLMNALAAIRSVGDLSFSIGSHARLLEALKRRDRKGVMRSLEEVLRRASFYVEASRHSEEELHSQAQQTVE
jgi:GntR family transcriptional repressor for pyruvate dehydrogenase complex